MELLSIGVKEGSKEVEVFLGKQLERFKGEGLFIETKSNNVGDMIFLKYEIDDKNIKYKNIKQIFVHCIANSISEAILQIYQRKILDKFINENYYYFSKLERETIKQKSIINLNKKEQITTEGIMYKISRKARILKAVIEYLEVNNEIIIEGFINFRLRFFINTIEDVVDKAVEEIIMEKEYKEFIKILQYFVNIQEPKVNLVNILINENNDYLLFDEKNRIIDNNFFEQIANEIEENDINHDDLLISSLITIAPKKIVVHFSYKKEYIKNAFKDIIKIIESVFEDKVTICQGCELCNTNRITEITNKEK